MNRDFGREAGILAALWLLPAGAPRAAVPSQMHFQGRIELPRAELEADDEGAERGEKERSESKPFTGKGKFKFAVVSGTGAVLWTNVPNSFAAPPPAAVTVDVRDGIFNVALGDPALGMPPLTPQVFAEPDRLLRVFFQGEVRDKKGRLRKTTPERELLPPQSLLTVPFAFASGSAGAAISKETLETLLVGATVQGNFVIAQNAVVLGSAIVQGRVVARSAAIGTGTIILGPQDVTPGPDNTIGFTNGNALIRTQDPGAGSLTLETAGGQHIVLSPAGNVGVGTALPAAKLDVAGPIEYLAKSWLRFTRATIQSSSPDGSKDSACAAEFGPAYVAGSWGEGNTYVGPNGEGGLLPFVFAADSRRFQNDPGISPRDGGPGLGQLACVHRFAPLRFTRALELSSNSDVSKDGRCVAEFGASYLAATALDLMVQAEIDLHNHFRVTVAGATGFVSYGGGQVNPQGVGSHPVACIHK